jgi:hypothetical protein
VLVSIASIAIGAGGAGSSATPFSCSAVSFVIVENLGVIVLSEIVQSEHWSGR